MSDKRPLAIIIRFEKESGKMRDVEVIWRDRKKYWVLLEARRSWPTKTHWFECNDVPLRDLRIEIDRIRGCLVVLFWYDKNFMIGGVEVHDLTITKDGIGIVVTYSGSYRVVTYLHPEITYAILAKEVFG